MGMTGDAHKFFEGSGNERFWEGIVVIVVPQSYSTL